MIAPSIPVEMNSGFARPARDLDALFAPRHIGYVGADVGLSIPLGDGRTLWVFGDTLVGSSNTNARTWEAMPHNSIAIQPSAVVDPGAIQWHFMDSAGKATAFFRLPSSAAGEWFWPGTGCVIGGELFVFGYGVVAATNDCEALAFRVERGWMFRISNVSAEPSDWIMTAAPINWNVGGAIYCSACYQEDDFLYLLGFDLSKAHVCGQRPAVLTRVASTDLLLNGAGCNAQFWTRSGAGCVWSASASPKLESLFVPSVTECSLYYDRPRRRFLATTYTGQHPYLLIVTANEITGPWSTPSSIYECPEGYPRERHLFYTFRMHPQLAAGPDEMVLSYVVNARDPNDVKHDSSIYYPRFIRLDLREL